MNDSIQATIAEIGFVVRPVVGTSMMPLLDQTTDTVRLIKAPDRLRKYDIPLYVRPSGEYVLHRVIRVCDGYYVIRGDNTNYTEIVPFDWVIALADGCSQKGVWHSFDEPAMKRYAIRIVRFWCIRNFIRRLRGFVRGKLLRLTRMFRRKT
ncbi:MAG: S24/S26 family peptidase [Clostridia bacterium]|nr:S24/S26 family peptidase [Clostridia bacterium]